MSDNQLMELGNLKNADASQIVKVFDQSVEILRTTAKQINEAKKKCQEADKEVVAAKNCDFKRWYWNDTTKAIEYLQDACVALANSQISTKEAMDSLYQYQTISNKMISALLIACANNRVSLNKLQERVDEYLNCKDSEDQEVEQVLVNFRSRIIESTQKLEEIETLRETVNIQKSQLNSLKADTSNTSHLTLILAGIAVLLGVAAICGVRF